MCIWELCLEVGPLRPLHKHPNLFCSLFSFLVIVVTALAVFFLLKNTWNEFKHFILNHEFEVLMQLFCTNIPSKTPDPYKTPPRASDPPCCLDSCYLEPSPPNRTSSFECLCNLINGLCPNSINIFHYSLRVIIFFLFPFPLF